MFLLTKRLVVFHRGPFRKPVLFNIHVNDPEELREWFLSKSANDKVWVREQPILLSTVLPSKMSYARLQEAYEIHQEQIGGLAPGKDIPLATIQDGEWLQQGKPCWNVSGSHSGQQADHEPTVCLASRGPKASWAVLRGIQPVDWGISVLLKTCKTASRILQPV